jgi:predicted GNAT superfamily acetyltransferase
MIQYRTLHTAADMEGVVDLEILVWGMVPRDAVPITLLIAISHHGGHVLGAYEGETLIGFSAAFISREAGELMLWSHMAAVHPAYQSQGIGFQIKQEQRTWALANGLTRMGWTFDPLQPRNAKFNLRQLGAVCRRYYPNFYGTMEDTLNAGAMPLPSDRLEATWHLDSPTAEALARGEQPLVPVMMGPFLVERDHNDQIHAHSATWDEKYYCIELPLESSIMRKNDPTKLLSWQSHIRETLQAAFDSGYAAVDFVIENGRGWYVVAQDAAL